jgi:ATP-dependent RNA helicase DHX8/PRP22
VLLNMLGAIDEAGVVTDIGKVMSKFPLEPSMSRALVASNNDALHCVYDVASICAMVSTESIWFTPSRRGGNGGKRNGDAGDELARRVEERHQDLYHPAGDHITYLSILNEWEANRCSKGWCEDNFISYRAMNNARRIR